MKYSFNYKGKVGNEVLPVFPRKTWKAIMISLARGGMRYETNKVFAFMGRDGAITDKVLDLRNLRLTNK